VNELTIFFYERIYITELIHIYSTDEWVSSCKVCHFKNLTHIEGAPLIPKKTHTHILNELTCSFNELIRTGWRRCIGCLKLQVYFRKRVTNYRALLRKMTYEDKASYVSLPPCITELICINLTNEWVSSFNVCHCQKSHTQWRSSTHWNTKTHTHIEWTPLFIQWAHTYHWACDSFIE